MSVGSISGVVCRTCLRRGEETRSLHTALQLAGCEVRPSEILNAFFKYQVGENDGLPQDICLICLHQLTATYSFDVIIRDSWNRLTKQELLSESYDEQIDDQADYDSDNDVKPLIVLKKSIPCTNYFPVEKKAILPSKKLYCVECKEIFYSGSVLLQHCQARHPRKNTTGRVCNYCNERFNNFESLIRHRMFHSFLHVCEVCWRGFDTADGLNFHKCHNTPEPVKSDPKRLLRQCDQCGKSYPPGYITIHMRIHSNSRPYRCKYCPKRFKVPCSLNSHILWNHKKSRTHKCDMCDAMFVTASARSAHKRKHHLHEKKHMCENCGKKFFSKSEMQRHMLTHTGVKNFHCHLCDKSYQTRYGLNVHLKSHSHPVNPSSILST